MKFIEFLKVSDFFLFFKIKFYWLNLALVVCKTWFYLLRVTFCFSPPNHPNHPNHPDHPNNPNHYSFAGNTIKNYHYLTTFTHTYYLVLVLRVAVHCRTKLFFLFRNDVYILPKCTIWHHRVLYPTYHHIRNSYDKNSIYNFITHCLKN